MTAAPAEVVKLLEQSERIVTGQTGHEVVWHAWGNGPALILLHGGYGNWMHWVRNVSFFARDWRVLVPDLPGAGESDAPSAVESIEDFSGPVWHGLVELLDQQASLVIVGFSFGGLVATSLALRGGKRVSKLVLVASGGLVEHRQATAGLRSWKRVEDADERREIHLNNLRALMLHDPRKIDALALFIHQSGAEAGTVNPVPVHGRTDLRPSLQRVEARLAGIWGRCDKSVGAFLDERRQAIHAADPTAPFMVIEDAGHWVPFEQADAFNAALTEILA